MPARVIPNMEVRVISTGIWYPACLECTWFPEDDAKLDFADARRVAYQHNAEHHDGAGVEFTAGDLTRPWEDLRRRATRGFVLSVLFITVGAAALASLHATTGHRAFIHGVCVSLVAFNGFFAGMWWKSRREATEQLEVAQEREQRLRNDVPQGPDGD